MATCKNCGATIRFVRGQKVKPDGTPTWIPLDHKPIDYNSIKGGDFLYLANDKCIRVPEEGWTKVTLSPNEPYWRCHFETCPARPNKPPVGDLKVSENNNTASSNDNDVTF